MAYGDVGGVVTELIITCKTKSSGFRGDVSIAKGDAVKLTDDYTVDERVRTIEDVVFGQAHGGRKRERTRSPSR